MGLAFRYGKPCSGSNVDYFHHSTGWRFVLDICMSKATELAEYMESTGEHEAAKLLRQQEAVIKQCVAALEKADKISGFPNNKAAIAAARECLK